MFIISTYSFGFLYAWRNKERIDSDKVYNAAIFIGVIYFALFLLLLFYKRRITDWFAPPLSLFFSVLIAGNFNLFVNNGADLYLKRRKK